MGCQCAKSGVSENEIQKNELLEENNMGNNNLDVGQGNSEVFKNSPEVDPHLKYADYPEKIVELLNKIRQDPAGYADIIEESTKNIITDPENKIIYKKKVKVALTKGEPAFREAAEILRNMQPLEPLQFKGDICIPLPETEEEMKDTTFLRQQVKNIRQSVQVDLFFKDLIKIPDVSALLMIVDDSGKNAGKKRMAVLNKDFKYIGVSSKFIGKTFIAYFAFSK